MTLRTVGSVTTIGRIRSRYHDPAHTPVQSAINMDVHGVIEVHAEYADGLDGLAGFDYAWLVTWLGNAEQRTPELRQVPFLLQKMQRLVGIFATRGPRRINPIGLSLVRVVEVTGNDIHFAGVDMVDGTAVIDVKPYVAIFDRPTDPVRCGWFDELDMVEGATPSFLASDDH